MAKAYDPLHIGGPKEGLVSQYPDHLLANDAFPQMLNAYTWRGKIVRKPGNRLIGRLRRSLTAQSLGNTDGSGSFSGNIKSILSLETNAEIEEGFQIHVGASLYTDNGDGTLSPNGAINYSTGAVSFSAAPTTTAVTIDFAYFPTLPSMGLRLRELSSINFEETVAFDTKYAYIFSTGQWQEFIPGTTWSGTDSDFFWSTNYWQDAANNRLFWVTNNVANVSNPIRYSNGSSWTSFAPPLDSTGTPSLLLQCLILIPFRSRLVAFNTFEGVSYGSGLRYANRIRWSTIGSPITSDSWFDDVQGKGGFLDMPTSQSIVGVGFVRDNLVIYCERSTWQLRYTGRSIQPFVVEKVNTELGAESTFSMVAFDEALVGIGDKGIVSCDSFSSQRIDPKIPDFVFNINNENNGPKRVQGYRDFVQKVCFFNYPTPREGYDSNKFPDYRLLYNYDEASWAIMKDSFTCLGPFQPVDSPRWQDVLEAWEDLNYAWISRSALLPTVSAGNQQGYIMQITNNEDQFTSNGDSLCIQDILATQVIKCVDHNFIGGEIVQIFGTTSGNSNLQGIFAVFRIIDKDSFTVASYNSNTGQFDNEQRLTASPYLGLWEIAIRDNFSILSKRFNKLEEGQNIQLGWVDVLTPVTSDGAATMNVYLDYNFSSPINQYPENNISGSSSPDPVFNSIVPTSQEAGINSIQSWHRVYCNVRGNFFAIQWTLSNSQMNGNECLQYFESGSQILWTRSPGRQLTNS